MPSIRTENADGLLVVTLARGTANALNAAMLEELHGAMAEGPFRFALNEVNLGVVLPAGIIRMAVDAIGSRHARELFLAGAGAGNRIGQRAGPAGAGAGASRCAGPAPGRKARSGLRRNQAHTD